MSYDIKPFKDEVLCDVAPLEVCNVLLGQPYLWKRHVLYESRPRSANINLNKKLYRILKAIPPNVISLIFSKQCRKVISQIGKFVFFVICSQNELKMHPHPRSSQSTSPQSIIKWISSWKNTHISSPHLSGYLCNVKSNTPSI
jgi:hypothetical protein